MSNSHWSSKTLEDGTRVEWIDEQITAYLRGVMKEVKTVEILNQFLRQEQAEHLFVIIPSQSPSTTQIGGSHYKDLSIQPWAAMKSWLTPEEYIGFLRGNIIKYQARAHYKDSFTENLAKAAHYQQELTEFMKGYTTPPQS